MSVRDRYEAAAFTASWEREERVHIQVQEWLAFETIVRCLHQLEDGGATVGTLAHAMFIQQPQLCSLEDLKAMSARRWPRHVIRYADRLGQRSHLEEQPE